MSPDSTRNGSSIRYVTDISVTSHQTTAMESIVEPEIAAELRQILSNLVQGDNEIRQK